MPHSRNRGVARHGPHLALSSGPPVTQRSHTSAVQSPDLEIKDAHLIFNRVWRDLEKDLGREKLRFPKELILLGGAPMG